MTKSIIFSICAGFVVTLVAAFIGVNVLVSGYALTTLRKDATAALANGNYASALGLFDEIIERGGEDRDITQGHELATSFIVAKANLDKAKLAVERGEWFDARALLKGLEALQNEAFRERQEALSLLAFAEERIAAKEQRTAEEIAGLAAQSASEKQKNKSLQNTLEATISERDQTANDLGTTRELLEATNKKVTETTAEVESKKEQLAEEQRKVVALAAQAAKEKLEKFLNEASVYLASLKDADGYITLALEEIREKKDVSGLLYLSQAKTLFDDVFVKTSGLRDRADGEEKEQADALVKAAGYFLETTKNLRNAVVVIDEQDGDVFAGYYKNAETARASARDLVANAQKFVEEKRK